MITKTKYNEMLLYAKMVCGDDAEDVLQNALLRAWRFKDKQTGNFDGWLKTIIRNESYRRFEKKQFDYSEVDLDLIPAINKNDDRIDLTKCLSSLSDNKLKFMSCRLAGMSAEETGKYLGLSKNTVLVTWKRSIDDMRGFYNDC